MKKLNQAMLTIAAASLLSASPLWAAGTSAVYASSPAPLNDVIQKTWSNYLRCCPT